MKRTLLITLFALLLFPAVLKAQLEKIIVEKYYVSNDSDATDVTGGTLKSGSITYRVYVDMLPGYKLTNIYGDDKHAFKIASDSIFFNNTDRGEVFAYNILKSRYSENTVSLDTWLTLGQATKSINSANGPYAYYGVLKPQDRDGSFVGGKNNDGGSKTVINGLLANTDTSAGIPLTTKDGLDTMNFVPSGWIFSPQAGLDTTIFGSNTITKFSSNNFNLQNSGVTGVIRDSNQVLVAQLTTKGALSFELNLEISDSAGNNHFKYVAKNGADSLTSGVFSSPYLTYPLPCGCNDGNYKEYSAAYACLAPGACRTPIILGCMDPLSCNYNPNANVNVPSLCCYPGYCNDRDIKIVCPAIGAVSADISPNPVQGQLALKILVDYDKEMTYSIYDVYGKQVLSKNIGVVVINSIEDVDVSSLINGLYVLRLSYGDNYFSKKFVKN